MTNIDRNAVVQFLEERGTARIKLHHRSLLDHLVGTEQLLRSWGCPDDVAIAGLCHAVYGTDGLVAPLVELADRPKLSALIGDAAESAVHLYGCCDRKFVYPQLGNGAEVTWRDRFTGREWVVDAAELATFTLLTWANALEAAGAGTDGDWSAVSYLFLLTADLVGPQPKQAATEILGVDFAA
ncbi:hypothetical protein BKM31_14245 [[Actinomadura] parvosata subsp. kistnae]|uniref:DUF6817 domain-containing protein n=1 Tax=[Actinomadura] parvosata subsp. kistnae TaxID=1909395 RepID=A0A1U9ZWY4_9ACTN|nr:hypothetical protein [Nonomuraea sp. ATCC 55076]AQZ62466.1 hypothetical protein BKM31_14245 [Nonomuraea sp. ATCC 55076]